MVDAGEYRSDDGLTYDEWRGRIEAEADARKREARLEQRFAALEKRVNARLAEILHFLGQRFGEERNKLTEGIGAFRRAASHGWRR
ncbi:hypothetical protein GOB43_17995 [Sinorhizobium meliloti]|uniref:hypothetical protein n=1 Tax=Rhizobium meliloti TaxID=382 RepID=UPI000FDB702E|nr:hypothetical protein [Sinorhizobium meliloti]MDW9409561.1 hypothetical protein [Sinorhizobium meliloti]MDW9440921.1 hypothetical protein [Sinorhizobium meliloti]MDW9454977.1 hypothetical protein [Sinorhizobium meliloti]MDW9467139.1 hypothetical protein [Sinorhizobium meliloti]MDW9519156.1 hypothetical protein [Sinorhizobium meliloti]